MRRMSWPLGIGGIAVLVLLGGALLLSLVLRASQAGSGDPASGCDGLVSGPGGSGTGLTGPLCLPSGPVATAAVALARQMADALYVNPSCHGQVSYPACYYTWYRLPGSSNPPGAPTFPPAVLAYQQQVCPGCASFANGNYQCVSFVRGAYGPVYPLRWSANAFDLWALYQGKPGWQEIPVAATADAGRRGLPEPGDVLVMRDSGVGHVAIVVSVTPPAGTHAGSLTFANANSVSPYTTMPLLPDLLIDTSSWTGYTAWGYLRPALPTGTPASAVVRINQLDPAQYASPAEWQTWAYAACSAAAMTEVLDAYGWHLRVQNVLAVERAHGDITPELGLVADSGIADTLGQFGLHTSWGEHWSLAQLVATANRGTPVIVGWPPDRYAGGHLVVVTGGNLAGGTIHLVDSSAWNRQVVSVAQFQQWWAGFAAVATPAG